jgi:signal transduction histidine kinase
MMSNLDDVWSDTPDSASDDETAGVQRRRQCLTMLAAVGGSYLIDVLLLSLFALAGTVQTAVPAAYFAAGLGHVVLFSLLCRSALSERLASPLLIEWQVAYAVAVQLVFVAWVPAITTYFLSIIFIVFAFASLRLGIRNALVMWALAILATGAVLVAFRGNRVGVASPSTFEAMIIWASFAMVLLRCLLLGYYATRLRLRVFQDNRHLAEEIAERKAMEAELERHHLHLEELVEERTRALSVAKEAAEAANRAKNTFLSTMSHELLTPLSGMMGLTELLKRRADDTQSRDFIGRIGDAQSRLLHVINSVLEFSKLEAGRLSMECNAFTLDSVMQRVAAQIAVPAEQKGVALEIADLSAWNGVPVFGDAQRIGQILIELTGNALKFTEQGTVRVGCQVSELPGEALLCRFEVADSGIGIPPDKLDSVFNDFEQIDGSYARSYSGIGLGLAICRQLAGLMGGRIGVSSQPGVGSTFWLSVRLLKDSGAAA